MSYIYIFDFISSSAVSVRDNAIGKLGLLSLLAALSDMLDSTPKFSSFRCYSSSRQLSPGAASYLQPESGCIRYVQLSSAICRCMQPAVSRYHQLAISATYPYHQQVPPLQPVLGLQLSVAVASKLQLPTAICRSHQLSSAHSAISSCRQLSAAASSNQELLPAICSSCLQLMPAFCSSCEPELSAVVNSYERQPVMHTFSKLSTVLPGMPAIQCCRQQTKDTTSCCSPYLQPVAFAVTVRYPLLQPAISNLPVFGFLST